ncbi:MAG TPA: chorismate-binding protein [Acidimicrobiia bacterium]|nr:chorismate-binding protein [Acidimicrobiia bacterium]
MTSFWVDNEGVLTGEGPTLEIDLGAGADRYARALEAVRSSGREIAFASFTFDATEDGSVVSIPTSVRLTRGVEAVGPIPAIVSIDTGAEEWTTGFEKAMLEIETGRVEKVVLARKVEVTFESPPQASAIVANLVPANPGCYLFSVGGLVGASPELLVSLRDGWVKTLALAGTATDPQDLESVKISEEHRHVSRSVMDAITRHVKDIEITEQVIVPHGAMSHVGTRIEGPVVPGTSVATILADLHPTAAVAGSPTEIALDLIREIEPTSRGRYAGPVGWMNSAGDGVFAIALRCGQLSGSRMTLFAGGGLVAGSEEDAELHETDLKLAPMFDAIGHRPS